MIESKVMSGWAFGPGLGKSLWKCCRPISDLLTIFFATTGTFVASYCWSSQTG